MPNGRRFLIYGATGYTGQLITELAVKQGLEPVVAGRNEKALRSMANQLGLEYRVARLEHPIELRDVLHGMNVMVNCAGPFAVSAQPLFTACLYTKTHYLDVSGEIPIFELLHQKHTQAEYADIQLMPGIGYVVFASDCMAVKVSSLLPDADQLRIAISKTALFSRGSARTIMALFDGGIKVRRNGVIESVAIGSIERRFDFGQGETDAAVVSWPDVVTAFHSTGIPNIETFFELGPMERGMIEQARNNGWLMQLPFARPWIAAQLSLLPQGPTQEQRESESRVIVAEAESPSGELVKCRLTTPEAYTFTAQSTLFVVNAIFEGLWKPGFQTPAGVYGEDAIQSFEDVKLEVLSG